MIVYIAEWQFCFYDIRVFFYNRKQLTGQHLLQAEWEKIKVNASSHKTYKEECSAVSFYKVEGKYSAVYIRSKVEFVLIFLETLVRGRLASRRWGKRKVK